MSSDHPGAAAALPETRYARSGEVSIGYQVLGAGNLDLVYVPGFLSHLDLQWTLPPAARFFRRLAAFSRLILVDKRGQGVSDRPPGVLTLEQDMQDLAAVLDAVGSERAALLAYSEGGPMSALFAATYPERVSALVLVGSYSSGVAWVSTSDDLGFGIRQRVLDMLEHWGEGRGLAMFAPSLDAPEQRRRFGAFERAVGSPSAMASRWATCSSLDVTPVLGAVQSPTLVIHREDDRTVPPVLGRQMAEGIPGARYVELPGADHVPWFGDADRLIAEVEEFLTGARYSAEPDRILSTLLFTDIVGSTRRASAVGDSSWRLQLESHDQLVRELIDRYRGREIKTTGDGFLIAFDGPARAIRCAQAIIRAAASLRMEVRAGVHTGECEVIGSDLVGISVNIAARLATLATAGEVLASGTVKDLVVGSGVSFEDRGIRELKGVPEKWRLFAASGQD